MPGELCKSFRIYVWMYLSIYRSVQCAEGVKKPRSKTPLPEWVPGYDTKPFHGEAPVLELKKT